jgi:copper chaperone
VRITFEEYPMLEFSLPDMSCGHCASTVTQTCKLVDPDAKVEVDLDNKRVKVESSKERQPFAQALVEAGYPPAA